MFFLGRPNLKPNVPVRMVVPSRLRRTDGRHPRRTGRAVTPGAPDGRAAPQRPGEAARAAGGCLTAAVVWMVFGMVFGMVFWREEAWVKQGEAW